MSSARPAPRLPVGTASWLPLLLLFALGSGWSVMLVLGRYATAAGVPPLAFTFWQCAGGAAIILALTLLRGQRLPLDRRHLRYYLISGLISQAFANTAAFTIIIHVGTGLTALLYTLSPMFTYACALLVRVERIDLMRALGLLIGLLGTLVIVLPRDALPTPEAALWLAGGLIMPAALAIGNVYRTLAWPKGTGSLPLAAGMLGAAALWLLPAMAVTNGFFVPLPGSGVAGWATLGIIGAAGIVYVVYFELQRLAGPVYFSQISYVITASGIAFGLLLFDERHSLWVWAGVAIICAGVLLVNQRRNR